MNLGSPLQFLPRRNGNLHIPPKCRLHFGCTPWLSDFCSVKEIGLQKIWAHQAFYPLQLKTDSGKPLQIIHRGDWNDQNGPDFLHAEIVIDGIQLHGAIEIHTKASDWYAHKHHTDPRYNQTVLHVVFENNRRCNLENGQSLECLSIKHRINKYAIAQWEHPDLLPCSPLVSLCRDSARTDQLHRALTKRLNEKTTQILTINQNHHGDWWYTALELLLCAWLGRGNSAASQQLVHHLHKSFLIRNRNPKTLLAYLFGQSHWLSNPAQDDYTLDLQHRYQYLQTKHGFEPSSPPWNTRQIRPNALPQIRMAQLSEFLCRCDADLQLFFTPEKWSVYQWIQHFTAQPDPYWNTHFSLGTPSAYHNNTNGKTHAQQVITNALVPFLYAFGLETFKPQLCSQAMEILATLPPEVNHITKQLHPLGFQNRNGQDSQAILGQHHHYCAAKNCRHCCIGQQLLNLPFMDGSP